jgi:hypothetical protein
MRLLVEFYLAVQLKVFLKAFLYYRVARSKTCEQVQLCDCQYHSNDTIRLKFLDKIQGVSELFIQISRVITEKVKTLQCYDIYHQMQYMSKFYLQMFSVISSCHAPDVPSVSDLV